MAVSTATNTLQEKIERQKGEIERKHGKTVDQLRSEREKRIYDAITLKTPDRVASNSNVMVSPGSILRLML